MGDRVHRALREGKARTSELKGRVPDPTELRERVPELRERVPELRERGAELGRRGSELARQRYAKMDVRWARWAPVRELREALLSFGLGPMIDWYTRSRTYGREVFETLEHPVILVANHSSHLDTPAILRALPRRWRQRTAVAAAADYFYRSRMNAYGVALLFNTVPLARNGGGMGGGATDHVDRLIEQRWNLVMYPEGTRSRDGDIHKLRSGAAVLAAQHGLAIVPIFVHGTHDAMPPGQSWPKRLPGRFFSRRHPVDVHFGAPIWPGADEPPSDVMARVRAYLDREAGVEPPAPVIPAPALDAPVLVDPLPVADPVRAAEEEALLRFERVPERRARNAV